VHRVAERTRAVLEAAQLSKLIETLAHRGYEVVGPTVRDGAIVYDRIESAGDLPAGWTDEQEPGHYTLKRREDGALFGYAVGPQSWKRYLHQADFPLWRAERFGSTFRILNNHTPAKRPYALLGVRSCVRMLGRRFAVTISLAIVIGPIARLMAEPFADGPGTRQKPAPPRIEYSVEQPGDGAFGYAALHATANGKTYSLIGRSKKMCLQIVDQRDFDGNGLIDALVVHITACGGNCCPNQFFFVSALGDGRFEVGDEFADSWADPVIERWKGQWSIVVTSNNEGINLDRPVEITRRFVLEGGKAVKVEERRRKDLESIAEMRSEIFNIDDADEMHSIEYDLDGDGKKDQITGRLWSRWGRILWSVQFADGKKFSSDTGC
jgi:hypothetical protein